MNFDAVVFDVLGTVVDEDAARLRATTELLEPSDQSSVASFAEQWDVREAELMNAVRRGERPWVTQDDLCAEALRDVIARHPDVGFAVDPVEATSLFGRLVEPFAESVAALKAIRRDHRVFALTNGSEATMLAISARGGLEWTQLISADEVQAFKPSPQMYERVQVRAELDPSTTLFVAAHPWDLDGAKQHGYKTALVLRPGVLSAAGRYDYEAGDLSEIADLLE